MKSTQATAQSVKLRQQLVALLAMILVCHSATSNTEDRPIFGTSEFVYIEELEQCFLAKIDTGAGSASINAINIELEEGPEKNDDVVHFDLVLPDGTLKAFSLPVSKYILVKRRAADSAKDGRRFNRRPAINAHLNIGGKRIETTVNLADRRAFSRDMLIGKAPLIAYHALVDVGSEHLQDPCPDNELTTNEGRLTP